MVCSHSQYFWETHITICKGHLTCLANLLIVWLQSNDQSDFYQRNNATTNHSRLWLYYSCVICHPRPKKKKMVGDIGFWTDKDLPFCSHTWTIYGVYMDKDPLLLTHMIVRPNVHTKCNKILESKPFWKHKIRLCSCPIKYHKINLHYPFHSFRIESIEISATD